jgi:RNA polymerase sigma-70 factor, ECF subfamily
VDAAALSTDLDGAFPSLVDAYQDALYRFALRLSNNSQDAEDVAQEAFLRAYRWLRAQEAIGADLQLKPWLYQVTLNAFRNRVRKPRPAMVPLEAADSVPAHGASPATAAEAGETRAELARLLAKLPARYREAIVLRHVEDLGYPEIAAALRRPEGTIKSDVHRGLALLRAELAPLREEVTA